MDSTSSISQASQEWQIAAGTTYLNHGSFGPPPFPVRRKQLEFQSKCNAQPMDFFKRQFEPAWYHARSRLASLVDCQQDSMIFSENATAAMNLVASFFPLSSGDEVVLNDHEYGVVKRIWQKACSAKGANYREATLALPIQDASSVVRSIEKECTTKTRLIVVSHITSPTAITLPVKELCEFARSRGIAICIDGPHAPIQIPLSIRDLGCDFYLASCHKWLSAPFGTGFAYVAEKWQAEASHPNLLSWGRLPPAPLQHWTDHYVWTGTRDYSGYCSIPAAIDFFQERGIDAIRSRNHQLAQWTRHRLLEELHTGALAPDSPDWYSMMAAVWLPDGDHSSLQERLWENHRIEVPIVGFAGKWLVRVSCHLYNDQSQIERLIDALKIEIA